MRVKLVVVSCLGLLAQVTVPAMAEDPPPQQAEGLEEVVVTAQKFNSTVQNTPISISAMSGGQLAAAGITTVEGLALEVPGLSMRSAGPGQTEYEARGLASNSGAAPTVGFYLDEIPLTPPATAQVGRVVIDPDLYDIDRIEVLRGPQGTLYGSGSMGGTVKVVTGRPELHEFEGSAQAIGSGTQGGGANGGGSLMLNIPLADSLALRLVGSDSYRSGWIDRVVLENFPQDGPTRGDVAHAPVQNNYTDVNVVSLSSIRASLLYQPDSSFSILATALHQHMTQGGYDEFDVPPGPQPIRAHYEAQNVAEPISDLVNIYGLTITKDLGFASVTSASGFFTRQENQTQDASESVSSLGGLYPYVAIPYSEFDSSRQFSEELRLNSVENERYHWVVGAFYADLHSTWAEYSANPAFAAFTPGENPTGVAFAAHNPYEIKQSALFADGSYSLTDTLKLSAGLRYFKYDSQQLASAWGFYAPFLTQQPYSKTTAADSGVTPRVNLSWSPNKNLTTYASASEGFRPGGANQQIPAFCGNGQDSFGPDKAWDYEVGEKAKFLDNRVTLNTDVFSIKWTGVQETLFLPCGFGFTVNGGNARSYGPEIELNANIDEHWSVFAGGAYTDAKLIQPTTAFAGYEAGSISSCATASNCTLPILNVPKETASVALTYKVEVQQGYRLVTRIAANYVGASYDQAYTLVSLPSYTLLSGRLTLNHEAWSATLFGNNLTNTITRLTANNTEFQFTIPQLVRISTGQPRTIGVQLDYHF
jgi:iron complex outermembrane recepter protein